MRGNIYIIKCMYKIKSFVDRIVALREEEGEDIKFEAFFNGTVLEVKLVNFSSMSDNKVECQKAWLNHRGVVSRDVRVDGDWKNFESSLAYAFYKNEPEIINYIKVLEKDLNLSLIEIEI